MNKNKNTIDRELYKQKLIEWYLSSTGIEEFDRNRLTDIHDAVEYFSQLDLGKNFYKEIVQSLGVSYNQEKAVEVGVGPVDSIFMKNHTTIVSPYIGLFPERDGKIYEGSYVVRNGDLEMLDRSRRKFEVETTPLNIGKGRVYLTQNVLHSCSLNSWYKLDRSNSIVVGIYGLQSDHDKDKKREILRKFADQLDRYSYNSGIFGNYYCEAIATKPKQR